MRILWIVNVVMPELADYLGCAAGPSGTWLIDISKMLGESNEVELAIACIHGNEYRRIKVGNIEYFTIPGNSRDMLFYCKRLEKEWGRVVNDFNPDIVHLHGTEYSHGLAFQRAYPKIPSVISIQGVLNRIKEIDFGGLTFWQLLRYRTWRENIRFTGMFEMHWLHVKNAIHEREMFQRAQYAHGTNTWDTSWAKILNQNLECCKIEYNLRPEFYSSPFWQEENCKKYSIFTNPGGVPLKGLHVLLKAVALLKERYPEICVHIPGYVGKNGYGHFLQAVIRDLELESSVKFLGSLDTQGMIDVMRRSHIVAIPSAVESSSLILREAMMLGVPCVAAFRGALGDFIDDKSDGFLYDYPEYPYLAERMERLFTEPELCRQFSSCARQKALNLLDRNKNYNDYLTLYRTINNNFNRGNSFV